MHREYGSWRQVCPPLVSFGCKVWSSFTIMYLLRASPETLKLFRIPFPLSSQKIINHFLPPSVLGHFRILRRNTFWNANISRQLLLLKISSHYQWRKYVSVWSLHLGTDSQSEDCFVGRSTLVMGSRNLWPFLLTALTVIRVSGIFSKWSVQMNPSSF